MKIEHEKATVLLPCKKCGQFPVIEIEPCDTYVCVTLKHENCLRKNSRVRRYYSTSFDNAYKHLAFDWNEEFGEHGPLWYEDRDAYWDARMCPSLLELVFKPCPFCGSRNIRVRKCFDESANQTGAYLVCDDCLVMFDQAESTCAEDLVTEWNRRAKDADA